MATKVLPAEFEGRGKINVNVDGIEISSCFDSGNLDRVEPGQAQFEYNLWTAPDCVGTSHENGNRTWFHFNVKFPQGNINKRMRSENLLGGEQNFTDGLSKLFLVHKSCKRNIAVS
jgi:hypothetical protein